MEQGFRAFTAESRIGILPVLLSEIKVRLGIGVSRNPATPWDFSGTAIWDTGAMGTCISEKVVQTLDLKPISMATIHAAGNTFDSPVYMIDLMLPNELAVQNVKATRAPNIIGGDVLVGMDVITVGDFAVTNGGGKTVFSFRFPPADKHIDFAEQAKRLIEAQKQNVSRDGAPQDRQKMLKHLKRKGILR